MFVRSVLARMAARNCLTKPMGMRMAYSFMNQPPFNSDKDYYKILQIPKEATEAEVKQAYYRLAKQYHPDIYKGKESKIKDINEAYETLSDKTKREQYESARYFKSWTGDFNSKVKEGNFESFSPEKMAEMKKAIKTFQRKILIYVGGFIFFFLFFTRSISSYYTRDNEGRMVAMYLAHGKYQPADPNDWSRLSDIDLSAPSYRNYRNLSVSAKQQSQHENFQENIWTPLPSKYGSVPNSFTPQRHQ